MIAAALALAGCATQQRAGAEAGRFDRWAESEGDFAVATTWSRKVEAGVTVEEIEEAFASVAIEDNLRMVGELHVSRELERRSGRKEKFLKVYSYCDPATARAMIDFSPSMAAYLPCRITVLEKEDGLWIYTMNMDMLLGMGRKMPPDLKSTVGRMRQTVWKMLERGASGKF